MSSLENENYENDGNDSPNEQKEGPQMLKEEILAEDFSIDDEMTNKLAAENKDLYVSFPQNVFFSIKSLCVMSLLNLLKFYRIW